MKDSLYDLVIIGGGINGCGIARDAAGRGLKVALFEMGDLASGTSSASTKLAHGGLRYLEHYEFRLVRESLAERERLLAIAPHIVWPLRFVLPHHRGLRPVWLLRLGLFLYDHLTFGRTLPASRKLDLARDEAGEALAESHVTGFEYSDCWMEDARLVVLNAMDAKARGARIATRAKVVAAERGAESWDIAIRHDDGREEQVAARVLVNAAGPWAGEIIRDVLHSDTASPVRLVQGSHIVVPKIYDHDRAYIFQAADGRVVFAIPFERDFTLIGTTDRDWKKPPGDVAADAGEIAYLVQQANLYFRKQIAATDVVWTYSGLRALHDDGTGTAQSASRDYALLLDEAGAPVLNIIGGKLTTYRRLAEAALAKIGHVLPPVSGEQTGWTGVTPLPGGDLTAAGVKGLVEALRKARPWLAASLAQRLARAYGSRAEEVLGATGGMADLGPCLGADLHEREVRYLVEQEFARTSDDILWRRSRLGLRFQPAEIEALRACLAALPRLP